MSEITNMTELMGEVTRIREQLATVTQERDALNNALAFCGATLIEDGDLEMNMKKYHAAYRCESHRANPWQGIDIEIDCFVCLKQRLAASTARCAELEQALKQIGEVDETYAGALEMKYQAELVLNARTERTPT